MSKKTKQINIRVSDEAKKILISNAKKLEISQSDYFEMIAKNGIIKVVEITNPVFQADIEKIIKLLEAMGNNINQIAKKLNEGKSLNPMNIKNIEIVSNNFNKMYNKLNDHTEKKIIFNNDEK